MLNFTPEQLFLEKAKSFVLNKYGERFHQKASEQLCLSLFRNLSLMRQSSAFLEDAALAVPYRAGSFASAVVELQAERFEAAEFDRQDPQAWSQLQEAIKRVNRLTDRPGV